MKLGTYFSLLTHLNRKKTIADNGVIEEAMPLSVCKMTNYLVDIV